MTVYFLGSMIETLKSFRSSNADSPCFLLETNVGSTKKSASGNALCKPIKLESTHKFVSIPTTSISFCSSLLSNKVSLISAKVSGGDRKVILFDHSFISLGRKKRDQLQIFPFLFFVLQFDWNIPCE